jgi:5-enolpyruvylshikimate-3-phosphate synthase
MASFDIEELKKNNQTSYLALILERLAREEAEVREMLDSDDTLHELAANELKSIQEQRDATEKQIQEILDKEKEEEEFPNEIVL